MRAMATHRVILNSQIYHEMPIGDPLAIKNPPTGKRMMFLAQDTDGHLQKYLLAVSLHWNKYSLLRTDKCPRIDRTRRRADKALPSSATHPDDTLDTIDELIRQDTG